MQSLCTRQIKSCCDGYQKVTNSTTSTQNSTSSTKPDHPLKTKDFDHYDILGLPFSLSDFENNQNDSKNVGLEKLLEAGFLYNTNDKQNKDLDKVKPDRRPVENGNALNFLEYSDFDENGANLDSDENDALFCEKVSQCGGLYHRTEYIENHPEFNEISTLDYPITYPNSLSCEWHIQAPEGYIVELNMGYIEIESNRDCQYDKLRIWDDAVERVLCGFGRPQPIISKAENLYLRFTSDSSGRHRGFSAHYKFVKREDEACEYPFEWNACPASCNITCDDVNPFNEDRRTCDERDSESYPLSSHDPPNENICKPACACPQHKPLQR